MIASQGQLGSALLKDLRRRGEEVIGVEREICDLSCPRSLQRLFQRFGPLDVVYNAGAFTAVDLAETRRRQAFRVNAIGPGFLGALCRERAVRLVHFSTDYVFGEGHQAPIDEICTPEPLSVYGRSKFLGERLVKEHFPEALILRTCGLYSAQRPNFLRTILGAGLSGRPLQVVHDQWVTPTPAKSLARLAIELVDKGKAGLYHASANGSCTWYEFAVAIFEELDLPVEIEPVDSTCWPAPAPRPSYSVLSNTLLEREGLDSFGEWREELRAFLQSRGTFLLEDLEKVRAQAERLAG